MKLLSVLLVTSSFLSSVIGQEEFFEKYKYTKAITKCFGNESYLRYLSKIQRAKADCSRHGHPDNTDAVVVARPSTPLPPYLETLENSTKSPDGGADVGDPLSVFDIFFPGEREHTPPPTNEGPHIFSGVNLEKAVQRVRESVYNFTCVLQKMEIIDEYYNINYRTVLNTFVDNNNVEYRLRDDLRDGINYCKNLMLCLPENDLALPMELQRIMAFIECERRTRLISCFRHDLRQNLHDFDLTALPENKGKSNYLVKLMAVVIGADVMTDLEFV